MEAISIPVKLLHEAEGHIVTVQTQTGEMFRGKLVEAEDNMNCLMQGTTVTYTNGKEVQMENVYIRGSKVVMLILPDMLRVAPMFRRGRGRGGRGAGGFSRGSRGGMQRGRGGRGAGGYPSSYGGYSRGGYQGQTGYQGYTGYQGQSGYQGQTGYQSSYSSYPSTSQRPGSSYWK